MQPSQHSPVTCALSSKSRNRVTGSGKEEQAQQKYCPTLDSCVLDCEKDCVSSGGGASGDPDSDDNTVVVDSHEAVCVRVPRLDAKIEADAGRDALLDCSALSFEDEDFAEGSVMGSLKIAENFVKNPNHMWAVKSFWMTSTASSADSHSVAEGSDDSNFVPVSPYLSDLFIRVPVPQKISSLPVGGSGPSPYSIRFGVEFYQRRDSESPQDSERASAGEDSPFAAASTLFCPVTTHDVLDIDFPLIRHIEFSDQNPKSG